MHYLTRAAQATRVSVKKTGKYNGKFYSEMVSNGYNMINNGILHTRYKVRTKQK